jgi:hypothetical protein
MPLAIEARLNRSSVTQGEELFLTVTVTNAGAIVERIPDPRNSGEDFRLRLQVPGEPVRVISPADMQRMPGVPVVVSITTVPPDDKVDFQFELTSIAHIRAAGAYVVSVE